MISLNENGNRAKLLAAVAAIALMLVCGVVALSGTDASDGYHQAPDGVTPTDVDSEEGLTQALASGENEIHIRLTGDFAVEKAITISGAKTVYIYGNGHTIKADNAQTWEGNGNKNIITVNGDGTNKPVVYLYDVTFDSNNTDNNGAYGVNLYQCTATLENVGSNNSRGAGFVVNGSTVTAKNVSASGYVWGGINVDKGGDLSIDNVDGVKSIYTENSDSSTNTMTLGTAAPVKLDTTISDAAYTGYYSSFGELGKYYGTVSSSAGDTPVNITVQSDTTMTGDFTLEAYDTITVNDGATLTVAPSATLTNNGTVTVDQNGTIGLRGTMNGDVTVNGTFTAYSGSTFSGIKFSDDSEGTMDLTAGSETLTIEGGTYTNDTINVSKDQILIIKGNVTLAGTATLDVKGKLIVSEGATLTLNDSSKILLSGVTANLDVQGTINVNSSSPSTDGAIQIDANTTADVSGSIVVNAESATGKYGMDVEGTLNVSGSVTGAVGSSISVDGGTVNVASGGSLTVNGTLRSTGTAAYNNSGTVTVNGTVNATADIHFALKGAGASVVINSLTKATGATSGRIVVDYGGNSVEFAPTSYTVSGLTVTAAGTEDFPTLDISGSVNTSSTTANTECIVTNGDVTVSGTLTMGAYVNMQVESGTLTVSGTLTKTAQETNIDNGGNIILDGEGTVTSGNTIGGDGTILAAMYTSNSVYTYTTLSNAIGSGATDITLLGDYVIDSDVTIPSGTTVRYAGAVSIGTKSDNTVTVTVNDGGAFLKSGNGSVEVYGTLTAANASTGISPSPSISSDVVSTSGTAVTYTNIMNALSNTTSGTITLARDATISSGSTLASGVTLDTAGYRLTVSGCTFTVDGTLFLNGGSVLGFESSTGNIPVEGTVALNGTIRSDASLSAYQDTIPGAYYTMTDSVTGISYYIQPVADAVGNIASADRQTMDVYGDNTVTDITVAGSTGTAGATLNVYGTITGTSVTLSNATMNVDASGSVTASVATGNGSVTATGAGNVTFKSADDGIDVSGTPSGSIAVASGTAIVSGTLAAGDKVTVSSGATLSIVDGGSVTDVESMTVNGTLDVRNGGTLAGDGTMTVFGTLNVAELTSTANAGRFSIGTLYVGISADYRTTSSATVSGTAGFTTAMYVSAGSTVPDGMTGASGMTNATFYIGTTLWMTVYGNGVQDIQVGYAPIENGLFKGWKDADGNNVTDTSDLDKDISTDGNPVLYADAKYDIYNVDIIADSGIDTIAIDGRVMEKSGNVFSLDGLTAGTHTVTYTLKGGYTGTATLSVGSGSDNAVVSGNTLTLSGVPTSGNSVDVTLNLQGTTVSESGPTTITVENGGSSLTDYLLIVLVVLIVIMAVIVAMRMMRS